MVIKPLTCEDFFSPGQGHDPPLFPPFFAGTTRFQFFTILKGGPGWSA